MDKLKMEYFNLQKFFDCSIIATFKLKYLSKTSHIRMEISTVSRIVFSLEQNKEYSL